MSAILNAEETSPVVILDRISAALEGTYSTPRSLSTLFLRTGVSLAVQNKNEDANWAELRDSVRREVDASFDRTVKLYEAGRAAA